MIGMSEQHVVDASLTIDVDARDEAALLSLADGYHPRATRFLGLRRAGDHWVKAYAIEVPGREVGEREEAAALQLAARQLLLDRSAGSTGLGFVIVHAAADGDYVLVQSWVEDYMSRLAVFAAPAADPDALRPASTGLAPCVWEAEVIAHERAAFVNRVLNAQGPVEDRLRTWAVDVLPPPS
jgi:hypothetical protein